MHLVQPGFEPVPLQELERQVEAASAACAAAEAKIEAAEARAEERAAAAAYGDACRCEMERSLAEAAVAKAEVEARLVAASALVEERERERDAAALQGVEAREKLERMEEEAASLQEALRQKVPALATRPSAACSCFGCLRHSCASGFTPFYFADHALVDPGDRL